MESRITIEVDFENNNLPIIQIVSRESDDVRDKLIKTFLQSLRHCSRWTVIEFVGNNNDRTPDGIATAWTWKLIPLTPDQLEKEASLMSATYNQYVLTSDKARKAVEEREPTLKELQLILHKMDFYKCTEGFIAPVWGGEFTFFEQEPMYGARPITRKQVVSMIDES